MSTSTNLLILATEGGIPTSNPWSQVAVPLGILIFVGSVYLLLRSNLGTRRGYLVMSTSLWGFGFLISLFWAFGAPGTPPTTGPQNLPGQPGDAYQPVWVAFAGDAAVVTEEGSPYNAVATYPEGWGAVPDDFTDEVDAGVQSITSFFSGLAEEGEEPGTYTNLLFGSETVVGEPQYAEAANGRPMLAVTVAPTCQLGLDGADPTEMPPFCEGQEVGDLIPEDAVLANGNPARVDQTFFGFFDAGAPYFPSLVMSGVMLALLVVHLLLLARDEGRERRERYEAREEAVETEERATVSV